ncbi:MAG: cation:proton antiporter [Spirochaetales bacterium]|nr:cation:proton antiporter [Spirochaetales bacterium]
MTHLMTRLVLQLAVLIILSRILGFVFSTYLKQPRVLGELAAGMIVGPYALGQLTVPFLHGPLFPQFHGALPVSPELYGFAVVASIVLLFMAGLETDLPTFLRFSGVASVVGIGGVVVTFALGSITAILFLPGVDHLFHPTALFLGTLSTATSVGITARILSEKRKMSTPEGVTILAAAVLDDVIGIVLLAVVVGVAKIHTTTGPIPWGHIGLIALKAFGFWLVCTVIGILVAPKLTKGLKYFKGIDIISSISLGIAFILAGLVESVGLAMIIGAYITGLSLSQTDIAFELREHLEGVYSFIVPIFFAVMGMMVDFTAIGRVFVFGLIFSAVGIFGKIIGCGVPALATGFNLKGALRIGVGMLPRGEVTLIIAGIGLSVGAIGQDIFGVAIMTLLISSVLAPPLLIRVFGKGSGYRKSLEKGDETALRSIDLEFPSRRMTDFFIDELVKAFREEEFFVQRLDFDDSIYHIRKDETLISIIRKHDQISLRMNEQDEQFVRLLVLEEILELKDFLRAIESMKSPDTMGADLLMGLFADEKP